VVWLPPARDELAELWIQASDRQGVADAANAIDRQLRKNADTQGQPFFGRRVLLVSPLSVTFAVSLADRTVTVMQVHRIDP
jgi:hypothetical protein